MITYTNEEIIRIVEGLFKDRTIMFIYYCGSIAYRTNDENSDNDITVILEDLKGSVRMSKDNLDIFAYGIDRYLDVQNLKENIPHYYKIHIDSVLTIEANLIYLDERFKNEFNLYKDIMNEKNLKSFLISFIEYHKVRIDSSVIPAKWQYHILRVRGMLDHFDKTGKLAIIIEEPWRTYLFDYKKNYASVEGLKY